jgi:F0F1-type ATP synthase epsilon subunit
MAGEEGFGQLEVKLYSPFYTYFDGGAESVSAANETGPFDILPGHANFFTLLTPGDVHIKSAGEDYTFAVSRGVVQVADNTVKLFVDI